MQNYSGSCEDDAFAEWRRTGRIPVTAELQQWCEHTRHRVGQGCRIQRVHVVTEPLTDYVRFELASYAPNVQAGEDVRIIPVRGEQWPTDVHAADYWLIDARRLWTMRYSADGAWLGAEPTTDPRCIADAHFGDPRTLAGQLDRLLALLGYPQVDIGAVPFTAAMPVFP